MHWLGHLTITDQIRIKFQQLYRWCVCNKLTINSDKTNFILFHTINKPLPKDFNEIVVDSMIIKRVKSFKYLGLILDETLNWGDHVNSLCSSLLKYFGIFNQIKHKVYAKIARQIYFAFIYSRIKYGIELYGNCSATNLNKIQTLQNKLMKMLLQLDRLTPTNSLHHNLNILKVQDIFKCNQLNFVNDILLKRCPEVFFEYFVPKQNAYDLRTKGQLVVPPARIPFGDRQVRIKGA